MNRSFFILLLNLFPLVSFSQEWKSFTDTAGDFTATYPANWVNKIKEGNRVFFTSPRDGVKDNFFENINIKVVSNGSYDTAKVKDLFPGVTRQISNSFSGFKEESLRYFKWNGMDAAELVYSGYHENDKTTKVRCRQWFCFYKSKLYIVTYVASSANPIHDNTARKIMNGIVFK